MKKIIFFLIILTTTHTYANEKIQICSRLGVLASEISKESQSQNVSIDKTKTYREISFLDQTDPEIRKRIKDFIIESRKFMSLETMSSFFTHACLYDYSMNINAIKVMAPEVGLKCSDNASPDCINKVMINVTSS